MIFLQEKELIKHNIYLLCSNDFFLLQDTAYDIKKVILASNNFTKINCDISQSDLWERLELELNTLSLFQEKKLVSLYLSDKALTNKQSQQLIELVKQVKQQDNILLISYQKLSRQIENSSLYKTCSSLGYCLSLWDIKLNKLSSWLNYKAKKLNVSLSAEGSNYIIRRNEGNLLAISQELEKLSLLFPSSKQITLTDLKNKIAKNNIYDHYTLVDNIIEGNAAKAISILDELLKDRATSSLLFWSINNLLKALIELKSSQVSNTDFSSLFRKYRIWPQKQSFYQKKVELLSIKQLKDLLKELQNADIAHKYSKEQLFRHKLNKIVISLAASKQALC